MKKKITAILTAAMLLLAGGCGSADKESTTGGDQPATQASGTEAGSEAGSEEGTEASSAAAPGQKSGKSLSMSVNRSTGKMNISRAAKKDTSMGEGDTWTIFVYLCGTDLESSGQGSATSDLSQMLQAEASDNVKFVVQTGGTSQWINEYFSADSCERWVVQNQNMEKVDTVELTNMGDPETLSDFLTCGIQTYPATRMGVIFWDHGGGSIQGACVDELNNGDTLDLSEINTAFSQVYESMTDKFEFIGFDCCLMGTAETANVLATYARYFYASQETEPGSGWDYTTYGTYLAQNPGADGADLGKVIADSFYDECAQGGEENSCTLTILNLDKMDEFTVAFNDYAKTLYEAAENDLNGVVRGIRNADNFGGNNQSEGYTNMVDIGGIINNCSSYADGTAALQALNDCIVYNKNGSTHAQASGLSVYYPLKSEGSEELNKFSGICISPYYLSLVDRVSKGYSEEGYTNDGLFTEEGDWTSEDCQSESISDDAYFNYADEESDGKSQLITFAVEPVIDDSGFHFQLDESGLENATMVAASIYMKLDDEDETIVLLGETDDVEQNWEDGTFADKFDGYWMALPDQSLLATYIVEQTEEYTVYTSPIKLNGKRTNLRIRQYQDYSTVIEGAWDGIGENGMASREVTKLKTGDKIEPIYTLADDTEYTAEAYEWQEGDTATYATLPDGNYLYCFDITDAYGDKFSSDMVTFNINENGEITFSEE